MGEPTGAQSDLLHLASSSHRLGARRTQTAKGHKCEVATEGCFFLKMVGGQG